MRIFSAFIFIALLYPVVALIGGGKHAIGGFIAVASITLPVTFIVGMPVFSFLKRRNWLSCKLLAMCGGLIGVFCSMPILVFAGSNYMQVIFISCCIGAGHGVIFWFLAIWRNKVLTNTSIAPYQA
jgi:hypothetical protein